MPTHSSRIQVVCEDARHERFVIRLLTEQFGLDRKRIDIQKAPHGKGSAADWVTAKFSTVEEKARKAKHQRGLGFVVIVDGDEKGWIQRVRSLVGDPDRRSEDDRIAICTPTWSVETWILWLSGKRPDIDETTKCKNDIQDKEFETLLRRAVDLWHSAPREEADKLPSLHAARSELKRLPMRK